MAPQNPYSSDLGEREPVSAMREAASRIATLVSGWTPEQFERSYAPGKWSAREILIHLSQSEFAFGNRARMALSTPNYTSQPFDQDRWMVLEGGSPEKARGVSGPEAAAALRAMNAMNCALFRGLTDQQRATPFTHPEYGALTVDWLIHQMAGHLLHHQAHIEAIAKP